MLSQEDLEAFMAFHLLHSQLRLAREQAIEELGSIDEQRLKRICGASAERRPRLWPNSSETQDGRLVACGRCSITSRGIDNETLAQTVLPGGSNSTGSSIQMVIIGAAERPAADCGCQDADSRLAGCSAAKVRRH